MTMSKPFDIQERVQLLISENFKLKEVNKQLIEDIIKAVELISNTYDLGDIEKADYLLKKYFKGEIYGKGFQ